MKFFLPVSFVLVVIFSIFTTGCSPTSSDSGTAILKGLVIDTSIPSQPRIPGATVFLDQVNITTTTNDSGIFIISNLTGGIYNITVSKTGYISYNSTIEIISDDTTRWITIPLLTNNIFAFRNIDLEMDWAGYFYRSGGIGGYRVPDNSTDKDVQVRDTIVGTDTLVFLRSADLDLINNGYQTWFSNRYALDYTQSQFDTLSAYRTEDGLMRPEDRDYPNHEGLESFINVYNYSHSVWFFYLRERWQGSPTPRTFGALYIDSAWYDAGRDRRGIRVDIKINMNGTYNFYPYNKK